MMRNVPICAQIRLAGSNIKLNFAHVGGRLRRGNARPGITCFTMCLRPSDWPAIRWPWCSMRRAGHGRDAGASRANSTCPRRCSCCRRTIPSTRTASASSRPTMKCRSPAIRPSARRSRWPNCAGDGGAGIFVLEENIGPVRCAVSKHDGATFAEFDLRETAGAAGASTPIRRRSAPPLAWRRTRSASRITASRFWSAGVPYVTIPVADLEAAAAIRLDNQAWSELAPRKSEWAFASPYVYCRETVNHESAFHVRMIVPGTPSYEDPATGSAAAAFAGAIMHFDGPTDGDFAAVDRAGAGDGPAVAHPPGTDRAGRKTGLGAHWRPCGQGGGRQAVRLIAAWA